MRTAALLALLLRFGLALRREPPAVVAAGGAEAAGSRQVMHNFKDLQYYAYLTIGGQPITGLLDTGSFDLVVFDEDCADCGTAKKYASKRSQSYQAGPVVQSLYYGSGSVRVLEAADRVAVGPYGGVNLTFWNAVSASMPVLRNAVFNSIVGVGPPETPGSDAWTAVRDDLEVMKADMKIGFAFPTDAQAERLQKDTDLATVLGMEPTLVKAHDVAQFSICLGQKPGSEGYFIWNDTSYLDSPSLFTYLKVLGQHTFTINMTSMKLNQGGKESSAFACQEGCGAIIDSGTSLLLMPYDAIEELRETLKHMRTDCNDIHSLPKLTFKLDGKEFVLPPDAYLSKTVEGSSNANAATSSFKAERVRLDFGGGDCELAVMGSMSETNWGPLWILGMPFFRTYYTTFKVGKNHDDRALYVTPASTNCTPSSADSIFAQTRPQAEYGHELRTVNRSAMLIPRIVQKAQTMPVLKNL